MDGTDAGSGTRNFCCYFNPVFLTTTFSPHLITRQALESSVSLPIGAGPLFVLDPEAVVPIEDVKIKALTFDHDFARLRGGDPCCGSATGGVLGRQI